MRNLLVIVILFVVYFLQAAIITVDNNSVSAGDYATLSQAQSAATNGDTIFVYPSNFGYSAISVYKELHFFGVGFNIENVDISSIKKTAIGGIMYFDPGSGGSSIEGFSGNFSIRIEDSNITIKRNELSSIQIRENNVNSVYIAQNLIINYITSWASNSEIYCYNNIFSYISIADTYHNYHDNEFYLYNNVLKAGLYNNGDYNYIFLENSILQGEIIGFTGEGIVSIYNLSNSTQLPDNGTNILNVDMNTVFVDYENQDYHLLPGSPAIDSGSPSTSYNDLDGSRNDMGIYGGQTPFMDSGMPGLPSIFYLDATHIGSQQIGLDVEIKARSNEE